MPVLNQAIQWEVLKEIWPAIFPVWRCGRCTAGIVDGDSAGVSRDRFASRAGFFIIATRWMNIRCAASNICRNWRSLRMSAAFPLQPLWKTLDRRDLLIFALLAARYGKRLADGQPRARELGGT